MNQRMMNQLDKVLALADSTHDGEAVVAVRKARQMLIRDGLSFGDLARAAVKKPSLPLPFHFLPSQTEVNLEIELTQLRQRIGELEASLETQNAKADMWRQKALELEQRLTGSHTEAERWRKLAHDTVEKLWDLGQSIRGEEFESPATITHGGAK